MMNPLFKCGATAMTCALLVAACGPRNAYTVTGEVDTALNGRMAYLYDYQSKRVLDSAKVIDGRFVFQGTIEGDSIRRIDLGRGYANFILEPGEITIDMEGHIGAGTALNNLLKEFKAHKDSVDDSFFNSLQQIRQDATLTETERNHIRKDLVEELKAHNRAFALPLIEKYDNSFGAYLLWEYSSTTEETPEGHDLLYAAAGPYARNYGPNVTIAKIFEQMRKTAEGMMFADFTIKTGTAEGTSVSLSDYVGKGKYILVDFWASWCGPCREEMPTVRKVWEKYRGNRFDVVGVAVWDKRKNTEKAIGELKLPWTQIYDAKMEPMELYGFDGIPYLILFGPDGKIVARNLRGENIEKKIAEVLGK